MRWDSYCEEVAGQEGSVTSLSVLEALDCSAQWRVIRDECIVLNKINLDLKQNRCLDFWNFSELLMSPHFHRLLKYPVSVTGTLPENFLLLWLLFRLFHPKWPWWFSKAPEVLLEGNLWFSTLFIYATTDWLPLQDILLTRTYGTNFSLFSHARFSLKLMESSAKKRV